VGERKQVRASVKTNFAFSDSPIVIWRAGNSPKEKAALEGEKKKGRTLLRPFL
jgi:hypothetical protein